MENEPDLLPYFCKHFEKPGSLAIKDGTAPCNPHLVRALNKQKHVLLSRLSRQGMKKTNGVERNTWVAKQASYPSMEGSW